MEEYDSPNEVYFEQNVFNLPQKINYGHYSPKVQSGINQDLLSNISEDEKPKEYAYIHNSSKALNEILKSNQIFKEENYPEYSENITSKNQEELIEKLEINQKEKNNKENISENNIKSDSLSLKEFQSGRWTNKEHYKFIEGILTYGNEWKKVQNIIKTRSSTQARSHAQKFFLRLKGLNQETLENEDKLVEYIMNTGDKKKRYNLSREQKEKLLSVIKANLKSDKLLCKSDKDFSIAENKSNYLNEKNESGIDELIDEEEEDNLAYNKQDENEGYCLKKKISYDIPVKKRKPTFCSRKRKSSSDISITNSFNKIFNITKDKSHKSSLDITKNNNIFQNNLQSKDNVEKSNNNFCQKKININNHNFIINKISKIKSNNNKNLNEQINLNDLNIKKGNIIIQNNIYNFYNNYCPGMSMNINNNKNENNNNYTNKNIIMNNNNNIKINKFNNINSRTVIFHPDRKTSTKNNKTNNQKNLNEKECEKNTKIINNPNFFPNGPNQDSNNKNYENEQNEQNNPFNIEFSNIASNDKKKISIYYFNSINQIKVKQAFDTLSDKTNNNNNLPNEE